jgi:TonB family protein
MWFLGVAILVWLWLGRAARYRGRMGAADVPADPRLVALVDHWRHALGVRRAIRVVVTSQLPMPCTTGVRRPLIHLPAVVAGWDDHQVEPVIAHEVAHVARLDAVRIAVINLLRAVFFFHPLVWLVARHIAVVRERDCDERVLASGSVSPRDYGHALLAVLRLNMFGSMHAHATLGLLDRKDGVEMRLSRISNGSYRHRPRSAVVAAGFVIAALLALPMAATGGSDSTDSARPAAERAGLTTEIHDGIAVYAFVVDGPITEPLKLEGPNPNYPEAARDARIQGIVVMKVVILADGAVADVEVVREAPLGLTEAAVEAVRQWRFEPATLDGRPVAVSYFLTVRFNLQDDEQQPPMMPPTPLSGDGAAPAVSFHLGEAGDDSRGAIDRLRGPVLDEVMRALPQGVTVTDISLSGSTVVVRGTSDKPERLSELLTRLNGTFLTLEPGSTRAWKGPDDQLMFVLSGSIVDH